MKKFCPKCGNPVEELYFSLCKKCYALEFKNNVYKKKINISSCECGNLTYGCFLKKNTSINDFVDFVVKKELQKEYKKKYNNYDYSKIKHQKKPDEIIAEILVNQKEIAIAKHIFRFCIKNKLCSKCLVAKSGYYEAILQLRGSTQFIKDVSLIVDKITSSSNLEKAFAITIKDAKNSKDIELGTKKILGKVKKETLAKYKPIIKTSYSLYKVFDGKKIYRTTMLIKEN